MSRFQKNANIAIRLSMIFRKHAKFVQSKLASPRCNVHKQLFHVEAPSHLYMEFARNCLGLIGYYLCIVNVFLANPYSITWFNYLVWKCLRRKCLHVPLDCTILTLRWCCGINQVMYSVTYMDSLFRRYCDNIAIREVRPCTVLV